MAKLYTQKAFDPRASELNHEAYLRGCEYYKDGRFAQAAKSFQNALEYWPKDPQAWMALGICHDELNDPAKAEKHFRRALKYCSDESRGDICYNLGNALLDQGKNQGAIECYVTIPKTAKSYERALKNLGEARLRLSNED